ATSASARFRLLPSLCSSCCGVHPGLHSFPTRRSSDLPGGKLLHLFLPRRRQGFQRTAGLTTNQVLLDIPQLLPEPHREFRRQLRSEEHTSELQSRENLVCRLLLEKKKNDGASYNTHYD